MSVIPSGTWTTASEPLYLTSVVPWIVNAPPDAGTIIRQSVAASPVTACAVMVASPSETAVTLPYWFTVATLSSEDVHVTSCDEAL